jgi:hypothetical protein
MLQRTVILETVMARLLMPTQVPNTCGFAQAADAVSEVVLVQTESRPCYKTELMKGKQLVGILHILKPGRKLRYKCVLRSSGLRLSAELPQGHHPNDT